MRALRWKHVMHLIGLLLSGVVVLNEGFVPLRVEEHREGLLSIRRGERNRSVESAAASEIG